MCNFDQLNGRVVLSMGLTLASRLFQSDCAGYSRSQNAENQSYSRSRSAPARRSTSTCTREPRGSAKVVGKSLEVNNDDVRNQPQQDNQPKAGQQRHEDSAEVVGNSLNVNDNDVRNQNGSGTEAVKGGQHRNPDKKK